MAKAIIILNSRRDRETAASWLRDAPTGTAVEFRHARRTLPQNAKLHAMITDVARQVDWHGQRLTISDWKDLFTAALKNSRVVPGLDGGGFVTLGLHTSDMSKQSVSDLIELIYAFGAERGVVFSEPKVEERPSALPFEARP